MNSERKTRTRTIQEVLKSLLKNWGLDRMDREQKVFLVWQEALGETLWKNTRPVAVHHGTLVIAVRDHAWMQELQFMKDDIIKKLNRVLGPGVIRGIRFKIGAWEEKEGDGDAGAPEAGLDPEVIREAEQAVSVIEDPGLRDQVLRTLLASAIRDREE